MVPAVALFVLVAVSAWSALQRSPDSPRAHLAPVAAPAAGITSPAQPPAVVQWAAANDTRIAVAPRPTAVRPGTSAPPERRAESAPAAETVPVAVPPAADDVRPTACPAPAPGPAAAVRCTDPPEARTVPLTGGSAPDERLPAGGR